MNNNQNYSKWVACWGTATSITNRTECTYAKDLTLRYPINICFSGSKLRFHFSNLTGTEDIKITNAFVSKTQNETYNPIPITFNKSESATIPFGKEILSDEIEFSVKAGEILDVSMYFSDFTQMNAGTVLLSPFAKGSFCYGNYADKRELPLDFSRDINTFYFLNTIDIFTEEKNHALICYGDSITCLSWPEYLSKKLNENGITNLSVIRRAVCGTRILRQYDCATYAAYGLKGETRFPIETNVAGADSIIIHHGINDIIHPVGEEINIFRPMSDMPTVEDLSKGIKNFYIKRAKNLGLKIYGATLLPIFGWRTYSEEKEAVRKGFNDWIRNSKDFDCCIDFDKAVRDCSKIEKFAKGFDSGDHLHPSESACIKMAEEAFLKLTLK